MNKAIVVGSYRNSPWLADCLNSIPSDISTIVVRNDGYELGAIKWAFDHTDLDEFLFLQDSTKVKRTEWLYDIFSREGESIALSECPDWGGSYLVKYRREILRQITIPVTETKSDAIIYESYFNAAYKAKEPNNSVLWPGYGTDVYNKYMIHGREITLMENEHLVKYKNCWAPYMADDCQARDRATSGRT